MTQVYEKTLRRIKQLKKLSTKGQKQKQKINQIKSNYQQNKFSCPESQLYSFFESLLYGTWAQKSKTVLRLYNIYTKRSSQCVIFLNQSHVQLLTCIDAQKSGHRRYFNMKKIHITQINSEYQMDENLENDKSLDLILKEMEDQVILLFQNSTFRNSFKQALTKLRQFFCKIPNMYDPLILKAFIRADTNQNQQISWQQLKQLVRLMKIDLNDSMKSFIKQIIKKQKVQKIYFSDFQRMWKIFYCREQLTQVFQKYNKQKFNNFDDYLASVLDKKQFHNFLIQQQKQTQQDAQKIILELFQQKTSISFYNFCLYVLGQNNNLISESFKNKKIYPNQPLNHYYCYSSHNTYLTGNQLTSNSRVERYLIDLQNGIRCVEIDVHDGKNQPIVTHGYTLTSAITFRQVIQTIKRFIIISPNHTPIILSIENHCNQENQQKMAKILQQVLQHDRQKNVQRILYIDKQRQDFPTLNECLGRVIIKGPGNFKLFLKNSKKKQSIMLQDTCSQNSEVDDDTQNYRKNVKDTSNVHKQQFVKKQSQFMKQIQKIQQKKRIFQTKKKIFNKIKQQPTKMHQVFKNHITSLKKIQQNPHYHKKYKVSSNLLNLISMLSKAKLQNKTKCHWQSLSFNQKKISNYFQNSQQRQKIIELSFLKWFRSYPAGLRFDSSNYDPLPALQLGVQIIALNSQTQDDVNLHILKSFFTMGINNTPGYRLKPLLNKKISNQSKKQANIGQNQNQNILSLFPEVQKQKLIKIQISFLSALRIYQNRDQSNDIPPVWVEAFFTGTERDNQLNFHLRKKRAFTDVVERNSFNPKFAKIQPVQLKCRDIELAFLVVQIPECGRSVIPLQCIKHGWRVISLYDHELKQKQSKILCKIKII